MGKTPRSGKHTSSTSVASTAAAAGGSSHYQKASSSQQQKVSSTIASMLHELVSLVKQTQSEREASEHTLNGIAKTHDRMKNEQRISPYFKQKLQGLYHNALQDAKRELAQVEQALDKVSEIKQEIGEKQSRPVTQPLNFEDIQARLHSVLVQCSCTYMYIQPFISL
jgi:SAGA-associated factor 29